MQGTEKEKLKVTLSADALVKWPVDGRRAMEISAVRLVPIAFSPQEESVIVCASAHRLCLKSKYSRIN